MTKSITMTQIINFSKGIVFFIGALCIGLFAADPGNMSFRGEQSQCTFEVWLLAYMKGFGPQLCSVSKTREDCGLNFPCPESNPQDLHKNNVIFCVTLSHQIVLSS